MSSTNLGRRPTAGRAGEWPWRVFVALFFALLTAIYLRPPWGDLGQVVAHDVGDPVFNLYILRWVSGHLMSDLAGLWSAPFFYPSLETLSLSDHLYGPAAFAVPLRALGASPATAYNLLLLLTFPIAGVCAALVSRAAGLSRLGALVAGFVFAFAPHRWQQLSHFQILQVQWIPLVLWTFHRLLERPTGRRALAFIAGYWLHVSGSLYLTLMIHPALLVLAIPALPRLRELPRRGLVWLSLSAGMALVVLAAIFVPYALAETGIDTGRGAEDWHRWAATFPSYATPPALSLWFGAWRIPWERPENALCLGLIAALLLATGLLSKRRSPTQSADAIEGKIGNTIGNTTVEGSAASFSSDKAWGIDLRRPRRLLAALSLAALIAGDLSVLGAAGKISPFIPISALSALSMLFFAAGIGWLALGGLGTRSGWLDRLPSWDRCLLLAGALSLLLAHPAAFEGLAKVLPGFGHLRVPARFFIIASFPLAFFAGRGAEALAGGWRGGAKRGWRLAMGIGILVLLIAESTPSPVPWLRLPEAEAAAPAYAWLARQDDVSAIVELPCRSRDDDLAWMYLQPLHGKKLVNGYSGYFPPYYREFQDKLCSTTPREGALPLLRRLGVSHLLVHPANTWPKRGERTRIRQLSTHPELELVFTQRGTQVLRLRPAISGTNPETASFPLSRSGGRKAGRGGSRG